MNTINELTAEITAWADTTLPNRTLQSMLLKMFEELGELVRDPTRPGEWADICIMIFDAAKRQGIDPTQAIIDKMVVNRERTWTMTPTGTYQHDEKAPTPEVVQMPNDPKYTLAHQIGVVDGVSGARSKTWAQLATAMGLGTVSDEKRGECLWWYGRGYTDGENEPV